jgi:hypothetical protein
MSHTLSPITKAKHIILAIDALLNDTSKQLEAMMHSSQIPEKKGVAEKLE